MTPPATGALLPAHAPQAAPLWRYGALGAPLAFVALPLYVHWPAHYAATLGAPLAALGSVLLAARLADAVADPWIGRLADGWFARSPRAAWRACGLGALAVMAGFLALFFPPAALAGAGTAALLAWGGAALVLTYLGYSVAQVVHLSWGARLGGDAPRRARVVAAREAPALLGVLAASALPALAGFGATASLLAGLLALAWWALRHGPQPAASAGAGAPQSEGVNVGEPGLWTPWRSRPFRRLLAVFLLNALASAVPATLVLFFIRDRLQQPAAEPALLALYFAAAAVAVPLWVRAVRRIGLVATWGAAMALAVASFAWTMALGAGDAWAFAVVCAASGVALGADLVVPGALLAGMIGAQGHHGRLEGRYFGWWNFASKLSLALAAGITLPLLQALGYAPGDRDPAALDALSWSYAALPCALKLAAAALLWHWRGDWRAADRPAEDAAEPAHDPAPAAAPLRKAYR